MSPEARAREAQRKRIMRAKARAERLGVSLEEALARPFADRKGGGYRPALGPRDHKMELDPDGQTRCVNCGMNARWPGAKAPCERVTPPYEGEIREYRRKMRFGRAA